MPSEDQPLAILQLILNEKGQPGRREISQEEMAANMAQVVSAAMDLKPVVIDDPKIRGVIDNLISYIREMGGQAENVAAQVREIQAAARKTGIQSQRISSATDALYQNAGAAVNYLDQLGGQATAQTEAQRAQSQAEIEALRRDLGKSIEYYQNQAKEARAKASTEEIAKVKAMLQSEATKRVVAEAQKWQDLIARDKTARQAENNRAKTRKQIERIYNRMSRLITEETDQKNIPEGYKSIARAALKPILAQDLVEYGRRITENDVNRKTREQQILSK